MGFFADVLLGSAFCILAFGIRDGKRDDIFEDIDRKLRLPFQPSSEGFQR
jgi:hypothetical protein